MSKQLPILNYHGIESHPDEYEWTEADHDYVIRKVDFEQQLDLAVVKGYQTIDLDELSEWIKTGDGPEKPFMMTFDDGHISHLEYVRPAFEKREFKAIFFISIELIGKDHYLAWEDVKELMDCGFEIGSHGLRHRPLTDLKLKELVEEFRKSRKILQDRLGIPILSFSVPRGFYHPLFKQIAKKAGYEFVFTSQYDFNKRNQDPLSLRRMAVKKNMGLKEFSDIFEGNLGAKKHVEGVKDVARKVLKPNIYDKLAEIKGKVKSKR